MNKKYEFTEETKEFYGRTLHRIRALKDFSDVKKGDLGGWIESEGNLSHDGDCWIYDEACVMDVAIVAENATISDNVVIYENVKIFGDARVYGNARVDEYACIMDNAIVGDNAWISDWTIICDNAQVTENAEIYDEAIVYGNAKIYGDAEIYENAEIYGNAEVYGEAEVERYSRVYDNAKVYGNSLVYGVRNVCKNVEICSGTVTSSFRENVFIDIDACIYADFVDLDTDSSDDYFSLHDLIYVNNIEEHKVSGLLIILPKDSNFGENLKGLTKPKNKEKCERLIHEFGYGRGFDDKDKYIAELKDEKMNFTYDDAIKRINECKKYIEYRREY